LANKHIQETTTGLIAGCTEYLYFLGIVTYNDEGRIQWDLKFPGIILGNFSTIVGRMDLDTVMINSS